MARGILYVMTTVVPGLIKIGKTGSKNFEQRMYNLEHDGYRNVTGLRRAFAINVDDYDEKELLLHTIFEKSRVADTELFAIDTSIVMQLLSSFDGEMIYPKTETKEQVFDEATDTTNGKLIPDGIYTLQKKCKGQTVNANADIKNGCWTLLKGSTLCTAIGIGASQKAKVTRASMPVDDNGVLVTDVEIGECSPSFAGNVILNTASDGWFEWKNANGQPINIYRKSKLEETF